MELNFMVFFFLTYTDLNCYKLFDKKKMGWWFEDKKKKLPKCAKEKFIVYCL